MDKSQPQNTENPPINSKDKLLVQVNVIVRHKKGKPVSDLRKDDFVLLDKGRSRR